MSDIEPKQLEIPQTPLFVHSFIDEYKLDPYEFRVYAHVVRRVGAKVDRDFFASLKKTAQVCEMSVRRVQYSLRVLSKAGFLEKVEKRTGRTDVYRITPPSTWKPPESLEQIRQEVRGGG